MPRTRTAEERSVAVESLFRVRATETQLDEHGEKTVWHQGSKGADLLSTVNSTGHVIRQEFSLFDDYFLWSQEHGLRTGEHRDAKGSPHMKASDDVRFDREVLEVRLNRAISALDRYSGSDKYLLHFRTLLKMAKGEATGTLSAVTGFGKPSPFAKKQGGSPQELWVYLGAGFGAGLILVFVAWFFLR